MIGQTLGRRQAEFPFKHLIPEPSFRVSLAFCALYLLDTNLTARNLTHDSMTYADHWNSRWRGALSQGPIQMISSGAWDHEVETVELMDEDDAAPLQASAVDIVLKDITSSRQYVVPPPASGSDDLDWDGMDIDSIVCSLHPPLHMSSLDS